VSGRPARRTPIKKWNSRVWEARSWGQKRGSLIAGSPQRKIKNRGREKEKRNRQSTVRTKREIIALFAQKNLNGKYKKSCKVPGMSIIR